MSQPSVFSLVGILGGITLVIALGLESVEVMGHLSNEDKSTLKLVQVIFRHGDRAPTSSYPNDPYKFNDTIWPEGLSQLTSEIGISHKRHYKAHNQWQKKWEDKNLHRISLPRHPILNPMGPLRDRYDGFIGKKFISHEVYGLSSDMDRTIMSLESNLAGLFPPGAHKWHPNLEWQPIPLRTIPWKEDQYLHANVRCGKYDTIHREFLQNSEVVRKMNEDNQDFVRYISEKSGLAATTVKEIIPIQDILHVQWVHNLTIPDWAREALPRLTDLHAEINTWPTYTNEMKRLRGGPLLDLLIKNMLTKTGNLLTESEERTILAGGRNSKILMFSAHDSTLSRIMNTMGIFHPHNPPYAAALIIELHQNDNMNFVKIFYRNDTTQEPYRMDIPGCDRDCDLQKMIKLYEHLVPQDLKKECTEGYLILNNVSWAFSYTYENYFYMIVIAAVSLLLILILWILIIKIVHSIGDNGKFLHHRQTYYERI